jgi:alpha-tubulin suppressor-like RCC1 family protein
VLAVIARGAGACAALLLDGASVADCVTMDLSSAGESTRMASLGLGDFTDRESPALITGLAEVTQLTVGTLSACAVRSDKTVWCWGGNELGQVGDGTTVNRPEPQQLSLADVEEVSIYSAHACARTTSGQVFCWGANGYDQIGNGAAEDIVLFPWQIVGVDGVRSIVTGTVFTCALKNDHDVLCWGYNKLGELGDGTFQNSSTPVQVVWEKPEP